MNRSGAAMFNVGVHLAGPEAASIAISGRGTTTGADLEPSPPVTSGETEAEVLACVK